MDNVQRETTLQRVVTIYIITGLLFMLLPGTFLGVWNLISIGHLQQLDSLSAWIQVHGHAQIYGWIGTFILGIGFYSPSKMGNLQSFAIRRAWFDGFRDRAKNSPRVLRRARIVQQTIDVRLSTPTDSRLLSARRL